MTRRTLHFFMLIACISGTSLHALAQTTPADTTQVDSVRNKFLPTGIRIGYDLISAGKSFFQDNYNGWEMQGDVDFDRYYLAIDYGNWQRNQASDSTSYNNNGNYWRVGVDVNFLTNDPDRNMFFLGVRYGKSTFSETMAVMRYDQTWGLLSDTFRHDDVKASWVELTTGLKVRVWKTFWLGYTARFKFGLSAKGSSEMLPYDVPGFGLTNKETTWGFNYYLLFRLPVRTSPPSGTKAK